MNPNVTLFDTQVKIAHLKEKIKGELLGSERRKDLETLLKGWEAQRDRLSTKPNT